MQQTVLGITLLELQAVTTIIITLAGVGIPSYRHWLTNYHLKTALLSNQNDTIKIHVSRISNISMCFSANREYQQCQD